MAISIPLGILLLLSLSIALTCCCCPGVLPPRCRCQKSAHPPQADEDQSCVSLGDSQVYQQVADAVAGDERRRSASLPHSRQFQSNSQPFGGVVYGRADRDEGFEPRAAQKISNASVFRPYRD